MLLALFYVGARRLEHLRYLSGDPLVTRFSGLARLPTRRTVADWLRQFTQETLAPLIALNRDLVTEALARLALPRLTIDVDGSVIRTGATVGWAFRGFNPHHRKDPSYYPLVAHVAQTGHILQLKNRPGNVHDSKQAVPFLRDIIDDLRAGSVAAWPWSSGWTRPSSSAGFCSCSPRGTAATRSRSATGAGSPSSPSPPPAGAGSRSPPA